MRSGLPPRRWIPLRPTHASSVGRTFTADGTTYTAVGPVLYTDSADDFTFILHDPYGTGSIPYSLTITPESSVMPAIPELSTLLLFFTGLAGRFYLIIRRRLLSSSSL